MALVLLLRAPVRQAFGAGAAYALWLIPVLRLILPSFDFATPALPAVASVEIMQAVAPATATASTTPWLLAIWATGAAACALRHLVAYHVFLRRALRDAVALGDGVYASGAVAGPAAIGLLVPRILVPLDFTTRFSAAERALAISHERTHHARADLWANAAALGMLCLHWFNPLACAAHRAFRGDQELSCDAAVIGRAGAETRAVYAAAMVKSAWGGAPPFTCPMSRTGTLLRRLKMVKTHKRSAWAKAGGTMTVAVAALGGLTLTATGAIAADPVVITADPVVKTFRFKVAPGSDAAVELGKMLQGKCGGLRPSQIEALAMANTTEPLPRAELEALRKAGKTTSHVIMCNKEGAPLTDVSSLQKARDQTVSATNLDASQRAKVLGAIDEALAKARSR